MLNMTRALSLVLAFGCAMPFQVAAQEAETAPATEPATSAEPELSLGSDASAAPEPFVKATHGDWQLRCIRVSDGSDPCELYQLLKDAQGNSVAEISMVALPDGNEAIAGATIIVPLETLLTKEVTIAIDGKNPKRYPFTFCASVGCFARIGLTGAEITAMKKGSKAVVSVVPFAAPDQVVSVNVSLTGFTDAFTAVTAERP